MRSLQLRKTAPGNLYHLCPAALSSCKAEAQTAKDSAQLLWKYIFHATGTNAFCMHSYFILLPKYLQVHLLSGSAVAK